MLWSARRPVASSDLNQGPIAPSALDSSDSALCKPLPKLTSTLSINVRALSEDTHLYNSETEIENISWDITRISKMRSPGEKLQELKSGHLLYNNKERQQPKWCRLPHSQELKEQHWKFTATSDRVASITIKILKKLQNNYLTNVCSHIILVPKWPGQLLQRPVHNAEQQHFNARVGGGSEDSIGKFRYGERNEIGDGLVICDSQRFKNYEHSPKK